MKTQDEVSHRENPGIAVSRSSSPSGSQRLNALDSLRGIAAISVVFYHLLLVPSPNPPLPFDALRKIVLFGGSGIYLFFVISGFSLSFTMPRHDRTRMPIVSYATSRLFRIAPCFVVMLVLSVLRDGMLRGHYPSPATVLLNLSFLFNLVSQYQEGIVWASWTIGVEMLFYATFVPIYRLKPPAQAVVGVAAVALFYAIKPYVSANYAHWLFLGYVPLFIIGMLTHEAYARLNKRSQQPSAWAMIACGIAVLSLCALPDLEETKTALRVPVGIGYSLVLLGCVLQRPKLLNSPIFLFFGRISYSLYLVHAPIVFSCSRFYLAISIRTPHSVSYFLCAILTFAIVTPCAWLLYRFVELPGIELGKIVLRKVFAASLR